MIERVRTRGQPAAVEAARALIDAGQPHAILIVGPASTGKTTLALDIAAMLLCTAEPNRRPCRECRGCRMVESGNHPDLHRLAPDGPGGQIRIGERSNAEAGTVRGLIARLALLPVEGGARVAIVVHADRMNDDAQSALLKTLEEPPAGVTIILTAEEEEVLLPTVRSRTLRIRLGPVPLRDLEAILADHAAADPPTAARLGRIAAGRPGVALTYARNPALVIARGEIERTLLDLLSAPRAKRLALVRQALAAAGEVGSGLASDVAGVTDEAVPVARRGRRGVPAVTTEPAATPEGPDANGEPGANRRLAPVERRRAAAMLIDIWRDLARDLALVQLGETRSVRDPGILDDLGAAAAGLESGDLIAFLARLPRAGELLTVNVSPELIVDGLALAWPRRPDVG
jgi:DNA polymerase-3 subunit delta'